MRDGEGRTYPVYLSIGSNQGDRETNLGQALQALGARMVVRSVSSIYETEPVGVLEQPRFLNLAAGVETTLEPDQLLGLLKEIEGEIGRRPTFRWGPRVIDVDILLYADRVVRGKDLVIPHQEMGERAFVLVPLAEIAGEVVHPVLGLRVRELCARVEGKDTVRPYQGPKRSSVHGSPSL